MNGWGLAPFQRLVSKGHTIRKERKEKSSANNARYDVASQLRKDLSARCFFFTFQFFQMPPSNKGRMIISSGQAHVFPERAQGRADFSKRSEEPQKTKIGGSLPWHGPSNKQQPHTPDGSRSRSSRQNQKPPTTCAHDKRQRNSGKNVSRLTELPNEACFIAGIPLISGAAVVFCTIYTTRAIALQGP